MLRNNARKINARSNARVILLVDFNSVHVVSLDSATKGVDVSGQRVSRAFGGSMLKLDALLENGDRQVVWMSHGVDRPESRNNVSLKQESSSPNDNNPYSHIASPKFSLRELRAATNNFSRARARAAKVGLATLAFERWREAVSSYFTFYFHKF
ncbi:hypothetical protein Tco_1066565 [Tanacetum coccineum]|uniref:Uncharacterized protein n=1 Tax=Tanacetum coccineum TaxID=301880 RepID=A0ABQ5HCG7_9ASTR